MIEYLNGKKTILFFVLALLVAFANMAGFGEFQMTGDQLEVFNWILIGGGIVLRVLTKTPIFK